MIAETGNVIAGDGQAYRELTQLMRERGWLEKATGRIMSQLAFHIVLHFGAIALFIAVDNIWVRILAMWICVYGGLGIATNTHTSSHNANARSSSINKGLTHFGYTFLFGTAANFWWNKHCVIHHPAPNVMEVDNDANLMPWFAVNEREVRESRGFARFFYRIQWIFVPILMAFNVWFTQLQGWTYLLPILFDRKRRRTTHWIDFGTLILHWLVWIVVPMFFFPPLYVLGFYALRNALMGYAMFVAFGPAHFPDEAIFIDKSQMQQDYVLRQTATTVNFRTGFFGRLACSGVDYQIEHHLFPGAPHVYYPAMSRVVEEYCKKHGYPYRTLGWWESIWKSLLMFYHPKRVFDDVTEFRSEAMQS